MECYKEVTIQQLNLLTSGCVQEINPDQRAVLIQQVRRWGDLNTDAILEPHCKIFSIPSVEGFIGYRTESNCAVVFGDPICRQDDRTALAKAFQHFCEHHRLNVIYTIISEQFAHSAINHYGSILVQFGHKLILDPSDNPIKRKGSKSSKVRNKVNKATRQGISIEEYIGYDISIENAIGELGRAWLEARQGPQIYIAHHSFFNDREGKRWFCAIKENRIIGFLILHEIQTNSGWLLNNLITANGTPPGTSELLVISALEILEKEGCQCVVVGPVASEQIHHLSGLGTISSWLVRAIFKAAKKCFRLDAQTIFWEKFQPKTEPSYVMFDKLNFRTIKALLRSMNVKI